MKERLIKKARHAVMEKLLIGRQAINGKEHGLEEFMEYVSIHVFD